MIMCMTMSYLHSEAEDLREGGGDGNVSIELNLKRLSEPTQVITGFPPSPPGKGNDTGLD